MKKLIEISAIDMTICKFVVPLMDKLKEEGFYISVATSDTGYTNQILNKGYKVYNIDFVRNLSPLKNIKAFFQIFKLLRKEKPTYIHVHTPIAAVLGRIAGKITGVPYIIYTLHGLYKKPILLIIEKYICRYCTDYIFTVNNEDKQYLVKNKFIKPNKIKNINSVGIDTLKFNPTNITELQKQELRKKLKLNNKPVIGFVGRLVEIKGLLELVEAFIKVRKNIDCTLLLVGSTDLKERDKTTLKTVIKRIKAAGIIKEVIFAGQIEDIPLYLSIMDIFVLPSHWEGMAVSPLEAMSMEIPVIVTDIRGCREEITKDTGILIPPYEVEPIVNAIANLLANPEKSKQMGKEGRKRVKKYFSIEQSISKQLDVFRNLEKL